MNECSCCSCYKRGLWTSSANRSFCARVKMASKLCLQVEGCFPDTMTRCAELINNNTDVDFVDINSGCPIDLVYKKVNKLSQPSSPIQIKGKFHCGFHSFKLGPTLKLAISTPLFLTQNMKKTVLIFFLPKIKASWVMLQTITPHFSSVIQTESINKMDKNASKQEAS